MHVHWFMYTKLPNFSSSATWLKSQSSPSPPWLEGDNLLDSPGLLLNMHGFD